MLLFFVIHKNTILTGLRDFELPKVYLYSVNENKRRRRVFMQSFFFSLIN